MSKLNQYQIFVTVVESGSIAQAALKLNYSAPAVSKQLSKLEQSLQVQLFHRSHKKLDITEAGKRFYPKCKNILLSISQAEDALLAEHDAVCGTIAITLSKALCRSIIFDLLASFTVKYPQVQFDIRFSDQRKDLHDENLDFAFRLGKLADHSHMVAIPLIQTQLLACATPRYLEQHGTPKSFTNLASGKLILMSPLNSSEALRTFFLKEKIHPEHISAHRSDDIEGVYQSVRAGLGIGMLLDISVQQEIENGTLITVLSERNLPRKHLYLLQKKSQWQTQKQLAFKAHVKSCFAAT
ncbi:MAG: LysR family transcriptional regulator [Pseudomonadales bacterium]|nr:LysR family transcriptional regulator [Pseudomonadales bacterium]NRA17584.1 LysR family transcriptional regulator [Oceanospirillaceae bacterium]